MLEFFIVFIVFGILYTWYLNSKDRNKEKLKRKLMIRNQNEIYDFLKEHNLENCKKYISKDYSCGIVYDEVNDSVLFITKKYTRKDGVFVFNFQTIDSSKLISSEIIIDNQTILNTSRSSQLVGIAAGSVLAGGIGGIIGGLSANKVQHDNVKNIDMRIKIEDIDNPIFRINFLCNKDFETDKIMKNGYSRDSHEVNVALKHVERWHGILEALIRQQNNIVNS